MKRILIAAAALAAALGAHAQYAAPGTRPSPAAAPKPAVTAPAAAKPAAAAPAGPVVLAPLCFEPMDLRDTALISALQNNGLLCATSTKKGDPVRLMATPNGELSAGPGPATVWHRFR
jgi:hypothetical protein